MAYTDRNIAVGIDDEGVLLARIDMPGRAMNVFSLDMMDSLEGLLAYVEGNGEVRAVVLTSAKAGFLAGADLDMIRMFTEQARSASPASLHALCGRLGRLFRRLERSAKPYVAAINGLALGGGLEVALACHARLAAADGSVQLGLPEIKLGLLPGAGGTQRLPRLIGTAAALRMLLSGVALAPEQALALGLVDAVAAPAQLIDAARRRALELAAGAPCAPWDVPGRRFDSAPCDFQGADAVGRIAAQFGVEPRQRAAYPAYDAILRCVIGAWNAPMDLACAHEMDVFVELIRDPVAGNMVRTLFLNRQRAAREGRAGSAPARVAVLGEAAPLCRLLDEAGAPRVEAAALAAQDVALAAAGAGPSAGRRVLWLGDGGAAQLAPPDAVGFWLAEAGEHGRAAEIVVQHDHADQVDAAKKLAQWLRASVLVTPGARPVLAQLRAARAAALAAGCDEGETLLAVALGAALAWQEGRVADVELADVAVVLAGLHPAWTGGPFTYLRQAGLARLRARAAAARGAADLFALPDGIEALFGVLGGEA